MSRRWYAACSLILLLGACSGDPQPEVTPTPTPTASPTSAEPSASPSAEPSEEPESAEEFVRRWVSLVNQMRRDGDVASFRRVSSNCADCLAIADAMEEIHANGGSIAGGRWDVLTTEALDETKKTATVIAGLKTQQTRYTETDGGPLKTLPGGRGAIRLVLVRKAGEWMASEFYLEAV